MERDLKKVIPIFEDQEEVRGSFKDGASAIRRGQFN